jgi:hypothetical protein
MINQRNPDYVMPERRVLSMWQPWATLAVEPDPERRDRFGNVPAKKWETRAFVPRFELPIDVVIHATKRDDKIPADSVFVKTLERIGYSAEKPKNNVSSRLRSLPLGALIGVARIVAVQDADELAQMWAKHIAKMPTRLLDGNHVQGLINELRFGDYSRGRYAWLLVDAKPLPHPIPFSGKQDVLYVLDRALNLRVERQFT